MKKNEERGAFLGIFSSSPLVVKLSTYGMLRIWEGMIQLACLVIIPQRVLSKSVVQTKHAHRELALNRLRPPSETLASVPGSRASNEILLGPRLAERRNERSICAHGVRCLEDFMHESTGPTPQKRCSRHGPSCRSRVRGLGLQRLQRGRICPPAFGAALGSSSGKSSAGHRGEWRGRRQPTPSFGSGVRPWSDTHV